MTRALFQDICLVIITVVLCAAAVQGWPVFS
jgi:hypothetical protein